MAKEIRAVVHEGLASIFFELMLHHAHESRLLQPDIHSPDSGKETDRGPAVRKNDFRSIGAHERGFPPADEKLRRLRVLGWVGDHFRLAPALDRMPVRFRGWSFSFLFHFASLASM
jgi:hypothetical protein